MAYDTLIITEAFYDHRCTNRNIERIEIKSLLRSYPGEKVRIVYGYHVVINRKNITTIEGWAETPEEAVKAAIAEIDNYVIQSSKDEPTGW